MKKICGLIVCLLFPAILAAQPTQTHTGKQKHPLIENVAPHELNVKGNANVPCFYKRKSEWQKIIDSTWGPGLPLVQKLAVFDYYSGYVRTWNPTFCYTRLNWDSVSAFWRSKVTDSTSRGGFSAILSQLADELHEGHAWAWDSIMSVTPLNPGVPILVDLPSDGFFSEGAVSHFGAGLTALPDSSLLVYMVVPNHPLGLEPGDIVLGYEGIPWKSLIRELKGAQIPFVGRIGSSPSSREECLLYCAGENWHLFDTIDVVKHKTGQTVHLSLDTMITLAPVGGLVNGAQLPVPGVQMPSWEFASGPDIPTSGAVSYGVIQGTNIGYIYVYHEFNDVRQEFKAALAALAQTHGLIIDTRFNTGGDWTLCEESAVLTSYVGPLCQGFRRSSATDLLSVVPYEGADFSPQDNLIYPYPVAVLLGPSSRSCGDLLPWDLRYLDNVRLLGKSSWAIFSGINNNTPVPPYGSFTLECPDFGVLDANSPGTQIWGRDLPIDEHVWLTPDNVAKGVDDVVQSAIQWISTVTYAHNPTLDRHYARPGADSILITVVLANPLHHVAALNAILSDSMGAVRDSVPLYDDGLHGDGLSGDSVWGCRFSAPSDEGFFKISLRIDDITQGSFRKGPTFGRFTTAGPLTLDSVSFVKVGTSGYRMKPYVRNKSLSSTVHGGWIVLRCSDPWVNTIAQTPVALPDIPPGAMISPNAFVAVTRTSTFPDSNFFNLKAEISVGGWVYWTDSSRLYVPAQGVAQEQPLPTVYALQQNYPNPFNPTTVISFQLPVVSHVKLAVYDILGREVSELVNERKNAGAYEVRFDGSNLATGVYFYRLEAGSFMETKKLILLK